MGLKTVGGVGARAGSGTPWWPHGRTVLVIGGRELAVALRETLDRAWVTVCELREPEIVAAAHAQARRPWMVVGGAPVLDRAVAGWLGTGAVVVLWRGPMPPGMPSGARVFEKYSDVAVAAVAALAAAVGGVRLAPGNGLTMPDGAHAGNTALEALVASHPHPVRASARDLRGAAATLAAHGAPLRVVQQNGWASLDAHGRH